MDTHAHTEDNQLFGVEQHGIDYIPEASRTGTFRGIFGGYFGANVIFTYIVLGAVIGSLGLPLWQSIAVIVAGNILYLLVGFTALPGPKAGTGTLTVSRAAFGVFGNRIPAALSWLTATGWTAVNLVIGTLSLVAMLSSLGLTDSTTVEAICLVVVTVVTVAIALLGHATILWVNSALAVLLGVSTAFIAFFILPKADYAPGGTSSELQWGAILLGLAIIGAAPMSYVNSGADFSRYMPERSSATKLVIATALGGFVPAVLISSLGAVAAAATDMTDPIDGLGTLLPAVVFTIYLAVVVGGTITNNFLNTYCAGMSLLATGVPIRRTLAIALTTVLAFFAAAFVVFFEDLTDSLTAFLTLMVIWSSAWCGVFLADMALRRVHYDTAGLHTIGAAGPYWYRHGWNLRALGWFLLGVLGSTLTAQSPIFSGPFVPYLDHGDLSIPVGLLISGVGFYLHTTLSAKNAAANRLANAR